MREWWLRATAREWSRRFETQDQVPAIASPDDITVLVAGADLAIPQLAYFPTWGFPPCRITREIAAPVGPGGIVEARLVGTGLACDAGVRYRRLTYRYAMLAGGDVAWPFREIGPRERLPRPSPPRWRPDVDVYEAAGTVQVLVDLAGVDDDDVEVQIFEDVVTVEGRRRLPPSEEGAVFHAAAIRQGPFHAAVPLPARVDPDRVTAVYERGILKITLPTLAEGAA